MSKAKALYEPVMNNIKIKEAGGRDMAWVESVCKSYKPDILVLDMGDKFGVQGSFARQDEALKACAIYARQIAKTYDCAVSTCRSYLSRRQKVAQHREEPEEHDGR